MNSEKYKDSLVIVQQQKTIEDQKSHIKTFESFVAQSKDVQEKSDSLIAYLKSEVKKINRKVGIMGGSLLAILAGFLILK